MDRHTLHRFSARGATVRLRVEPGVFPPDPYAPRVAARIRIPAAARVLDLGCGSGAFGLWAVAAGAAGAWLVDVDPAAAACARRNARRNGLAPSVRCAAGDFFSPVRRRRFDVIVGNVPQTPAPANFSATKWGGPDGTSFLRRLAREAPAHLAPDGRLWFLISDLANPARTRAAFRRRFALRCALRHTRFFTPGEYDARLPGLWNYLLRRRARGEARFARRAGRWFFHVRLMEARLR